MKKLNKYKKPVIGISIDSSVEKTYSKFPWYAIRANYVNSIINSNGLPLMLPSKPELAAAYFKLVDGKLVWQWYVLPTNALEDPGYLHT